MGAKAEETANTNPADRLGIEPGHIVQEFGWDEDVDEALRTAIESATGEELLDETEQTVADIVLFWWRTDDGDLVDGLVDVTSALDEKGAVWLMTPKRGVAGHVDQAEVQEAAQTAGLMATSPHALDSDWSAIKLVPSGARRATN